VVNALLNAAVCAVFAWYCCHSGWASLRAVALHLGALGFMWQAMALVMRLSSAPARELLGMRLAPHFANPYSATSLTDFWARRWNITQGLVLRGCVYEPVVQGRWRAADAAAERVHAQDRRAPAGSSSADDDRGAAASSGTKPLAAHAVVPRWRRQLGAAATFVVSGLEHELFLWYLLRAWGWRWLAFFSLQGPLLAGEAALKRRARAAGLSLHLRVASLAVLLVLGLTADAFFWPPLVQPALLQPLRQSAATTLAQLCDATVHPAGQLLGAACSSTLARQLAFG
jgi:hypothetical protein